MKKGFLKSRLNKITAWALSIIMTLSPMVLPVHAETGTIPGGGGNGVSQGDVTPGDVTPGDAVQGTIAYYFPDDNFAAPVAEVLGKDVTDSVTQAELNSLNELSFIGVTNWEGLAYLPNLHVIHIGRLDGYDIKSLAPLKDVKNLELYLGGFGEEGDTLIGDIAVFSDFTSLRRLWTSGMDTPILSITGDLNSLPNTLESIDIWADGITGTIAAFKDMENLSQLAISHGEQIGGSTSSLRELRNLEDLVFGNTAITFDLSDFSDLTKLKRINLIGGNVIHGDLSELSKLTDLEQLQLGLDENPQSYVSGNIEALKNLTKLKDLSLLRLPNIEGNISSLFGLTELEHLLLEDMAITGNLSDLGEKEYLAYLGLRRTAIRITPEDKELFPILEPIDDFFVAPVIDQANSQLVYQLGFPYQEGNYIRISTNKSREGFEKLLIDDVEVHMHSIVDDNEVINYDFAVDQSWDLEQSAPLNDLMIWSDYLEQLPNGEHTVTLDYYWGGDVSTTFTVVETTAGTIQDLFQDDNFAASVAEALGKAVTDTVTHAQLNGIYEISCTGVTNWEGLEYLPNLHVVFIGRLNGYDIKYLSALKNIQDLILILGEFGEDGHTLVGDFSVFSDFTGLYRLLTPGMWMHNTILPITGDLSDLPNNLVEFNVWLDEVTGTLADFEDMEDLIELQIWEGPLIGGSTSSLRELQNLEYVSFGNTAINVDLSDYSDLTQLKQVFFSGTGMVVQGELSDLSNLLNLEALSFYPNSDSEFDVSGSVAALKNLTNLKNLNLVYLDGVTGNTTDLSGFTQLEELRITGTGIEGNISNLAGLTNISALSVDASNITGEISSFANMPLTELNLEDTKLTGKLSDLGEKENLSTLGLRRTTIRVAPEDKELFPILEPVDDIFVAPVIDDTSSQLVYQHGIPDQEGNYIRISTNKSREGFAKLLVDGVEVTNYDFEHESSFDSESAPISDLMIRSDYLEQLSVGEHTVTLDYYWGGSVSTKFTVAETTYTVRFLDPDGKVINEQEVALGSDATAPTPPTREGYTFKGWDKGFENIVADLDVTAEYSLNKYAVTFHDWDGTVLKSQVVDHGTAAQAPASPSRVGYGFTGWDVSFSNVTKNLEVTATYQANLFTVTFVDSDGTELKKQTVEYSKPATAPADPTRQGYEFIGWDKGFGSVTEDMTVTATYHELSGDTYIIDKPGVVDGNTLADYGVIIVRVSGVTIDGGKLRGNIRIEAQQVTLKNLDIAGKVEVLAKECTITDSIIRGSFTAAAESITMKDLDIRGNLSIGATNITLLDSEVKGNVTIERTVGNGHVVLTNVKSKGSIIYVKGGGSNSVVLTDSEFGAIVIDKLAEAGQQTVRVAVEGTTAVANTIVNSAAIIEDTTVEGQGIQNVTLAEEIPAASTVELRGAIKEVTIQKEELRVVNNAAVENILVEAPSLTLVNNAPVKNIQVEAPSLTLVNNSTVSELKVEENVTDTKVEGGKIDNVVVADGAELPVYVVKPQTGTDSGSKASQTFLPTDADGKVNLYGKVSVYDDVLLAGGVKAKAGLLPLSDAVKKAANEFAAKQDTPNTPFAYVDVVVDGYKSGKATVKFNLYDISENDDILVFHMKADGTWESIVPDKIEKGAVTVTFNSLSPVVFSKATGAAGNSKVISPKTSDNGLAAMAVLCVLGICAGLCYLQYNRKKNRR
jgi:hypothetical protein